MWIKSERLLKALALAFAVTASPAIAQESPPLHIDRCAMAFTDAKGGDFSVVATAAFTNVSNKEMAAVRFRFVFVDAFKKPRAQQTGTVTGKFSPGIQIQPRYAVNGMPILQSPQFPSSPAFQLYNDLAQDASLPDSFCDVDAIRYADGTVYDPSNR